MNTDRKTVTKRRSTRAYTTTLSHTCRHPHASTDIHCGLYATRKRGQRNPNINVIENTQSMRNAEVAQIPANTASYFWVLRRCQGRAHNTQSKFGRPRSRGSNIARTERAARDPSKVSDRIAPKHWVTKKSDKTHGLFGRRPIQGVEQVFVQGCSRLFKVVQGCSRVCSRLFKHVQFLRMSRGIRLFKVVQGFVQGCSRLFKRLFKGLETVEKWLADHLPENP